MTNKMGRTQRKRKRKKITNSNWQLNNKININNDILELLKWMKKFGKWREESLLQLTEFLPMSLRGFMTKKSIESGSLLVKIPFKLLITRELAESFVKGMDILKNIDSCRLLTTQELLTMFLIIQKYMKKEIDNPLALFWKPYLDTLPISYDVPYFCKDEEVHYRLTRILTVKHLVFFIS